MIITITRYRFKKDSIDSKLFIDGQQICDTAENARWHIKEGSYTLAIKKCNLCKRNIPIIEPADSDRFCDVCLYTSKNNEEACIKQLNAIESARTRAINQGKTEEEADAAAHSVEASLPPHPERDPFPACPQIKVGNSALNLTDCSILVGTYLQPGIVIKSRPMFDALYERIRKNIERGNPVTLVITSSSLNPHP